MWGPIVIIVMEWEGYESIACPIVMERKGQELIESWSLTQWPNDPHIGFLFDFPCGTISLEFCLIFKVGQFLSNEMDLHGTKRTRVDGLLHPLSPTIRHLPFIWRFENCISQVGVVLSLNLHITFNILFLYFRNGWSNLFETKATMYSFCFISDHQIILLILCKNWSCNKLYH